MNPPGLRRRHLASLAAAALGGAVLPRAGQAQRAWKPGRTVEIVVGTNPGTGYDRTARVLQSVWKQERLVEAPVTVLNKPGGGGAISWIYMNQRARAMDELSVIGPLLLTGHLTSGSAVTWHDVTPLCVLLGEEIMTAVPASSSIQDGRGFAEKLKQDPSALAVAMSGIGGQNHVTLGLVAKAAGAELGKLKVVGFDGSAEAVTSGMGGHVDAVVAPASSLGAGLSSGRLRGIGVASAARLGGTFAGVPTWKEQGILVEFSNWRGIAGPKGMTPEQLAYWDDVFGRTVKLPVWSAELERSGLSSHYLDSAATARFMAAQEADLLPVLRGLGFAR